MKNELKPLLTVVPHDHPSVRKHARIYYALTNKCNRSCPWCSVYASPEKSTELSLENFVTHFPESGTFEVQLEGGEPTIHPEFWAFVETALAEPRMRGIILCTNGTRLPRTRAKLIDYLNQITAVSEGVEPIKLTVKLSLNHYLLRRDEGLLALAMLLKDLSHSRSNFEVVFNVRRRKGVENDDQWVVDLMRDASLLDRANVFFLQRYGLAKDQTGWEEPFVVHSEFKMVNPDGSAFEGDLVGRSEAMGSLK